MNEAKRRFTIKKHHLEPWLQRSRAKKHWKGAVRKMEWQAGNEKLTMKDVLWSARGSGVRVKKHDYAPTLVAMANHSEYMVQEIKS